MTDPFAPLDREEAAEMAAWEQAEPVSGPEADALGVQLKQAAAHTVESLKDTRVTLRLPAKDLRAIRNEAQRMGLPYQI